MKKAYLVVASILAAGVALLASPKQAHALGPLDLEIAARGGFGTNPSTLTGSPNALGPGIGARAGVSFLGLYGGLSFMYYFGETKDGISVNSTMYGVDLGFGFKLLSVPHDQTLKWASATSVGAVARLSPASPSPARTTATSSPGSSPRSGLGAFFVAADINALFVPGGR